MRAEALVVHAASGATLDRALLFPALSTPCLASLLVSVVHRDSYQPRAFQALPIAVSWADGPRVLDRQSLLVRVFLLLCHGRLLDLLGPAAVAAAVVALAAS